MKKAFIVIVSIVSFFSCDRSPSIEKVVGYYKTNAKSKLMGGYKISTYATLRINLDTITNQFMPNSPKRIEFGFYFQQFVSDQMYGTSNKLMQKASGDFEKIISNNKLKIEPNIYEEWIKKVQYIEIPESQNNKQKIDQLILRFKPGNGDPLTFYRVN